MINSVLTHAKVLQASLVGSCATYGTGKDEDYVLLVADRGDFVEALGYDNWYPSCDYSAVEFSSVRQENYNLLITDKEWVYLSYVAGAAAMAPLAALVPQEDKTTRVAIYEAIRAQLRKAYAN